MLTFLYTIIIYPIVQIIEVVFVWEQSQGQSWIVNALFEQVTMRILKSNDCSTVTLENVQTAHETHLDSLAVRLEDTGIRKVMETLITGSIDLKLTGSDKFRMRQDLGLVRLDKKDGVVISSPIYKEVLAREITHETQAAIPEPEWQWEKPDGSLDMDALLSEFQTFWRENSENWEQQSDYTEAFPHLLLMAFLQIILNGGSAIDGCVNKSHIQIDKDVDLNMSMRLDVVRWI